MKLIGALVILLTYILSPTKAYTVDSKTVEGIRSAYSKNDYTGVIGLYDKSSQVDIDTMSRIIVAMSYRNLGRHEESINILTSVKDSDKNFRDRAKFELALSCYISGDFECSKAESEDILLSTAPANIKTYAKEIKDKSVIALEKSNKIFHGSLGASYVYDSNPAMSQTSDNVSLYGVNANSVKTDADSGIMVNGNFGYNYNINKKVSIFGNASGDMMRYFNTASRDMVHMLLNQGISLKQDKWTFVLPFSYNNMYIDRDAFMNSPENMFLDMYRLAPSVSYNFSTFILKSTYSIIKKDVKNIDSRDSMMHIFNETIQIPVTKYTLLHADLGVGYENATDAIYSNKLYTASIGIRQNIPSIKNVYLDLSYNLNIMDFDKYNAFLGSTRLDYYNYVKSSIHYMPLSNVDTYVSYSYGRNKSNVTLYDFERHQVTCGMQVLF